MRFFETILSGAALLAAVAALEINQFPADGVKAGESYTITYSPADDTPTTFILRQGKSTDLDTIDTLTTTATGGSFTWTPSKSLPNEPDYALEIRQDDVINYSAQFPLEGGSDAPAVSSAVSSVMASASSAASSAAYSASSAASSVRSSLASEASSMSSAIHSAKSSAMASITSHASASATISPSAGLNSTISTATLSRSASSSASGSATSTSSLPEVSEAAAPALIGSPLAAIFGAAAAFAYLA